MFGFLFYNNFLILSSLKRSNPLIHNLVSLCGQEIVEWVCTGRKIAYRCFDKIKNRDKLQNLHFAG